MTCHLPLWQSHNPKSPSVLSALSRMAMLSERGSVVSHAERAEAGRRGRRSWEKVCWFVREEGSVNEEASGSWAILVVGAVWTLSESVATRRRRTELRWKCGDGVGCLVCSFELMFLGVTILEVLTL